MIVDKFFSFFGKIALVLLIIGGIAYGAYGLGKGSFRPPGFGGVSTTATPTRDPGLNPEPVPSTSSAFTPTAAPESSTIPAGLNASSGLSFTKYQITVPSLWTNTHKTTNEGTWTDTLTLTNAKIAGTVKIFQGATGGAVCLYPGDPDFEGPSSRYDKFVELKTADGVVLRRSWTQTQGGTDQSYTICQKASDGSWGQPTVFGHMSVKILSTDPNPLPDIDAMIASLKKQ